jgi:hypothetical protein
MVRRPSDWEIASQSAFRNFSSSFFSANGRIRRGELPNFSFILSLPAFHPKKFGDFIGTYELAPGQTRSVTAEGEKLFVERKGKKEELNKEKQLFPETSDLFFRKGVEGRILFHYDATGKVESLIDRRNKEDVIWRKAG